MGTAGQPRPRVTRVRRARKRRARERTARTGAKNGENAVVLTAQRWGNGGRLGRRRVRGPCPRVCAECLRHFRAAPRSEKF